MRLRTEQLAEHLKEPLRPVYLISGDETLLVLEAAAQVRDAARAQGVDDRRVFTVDPKFDWNELGGATENLSLFSSRRLIDLRLPTAKPGRAGGEYFRQFAEDPGEDILLVTAGRMKKEQLSSAWGKALDRIGVIIQCWPVDIGELPRWLDQRMRSRGLEPEPAAARMLAERVEGNLLAAAQEVDKLLLLKGQGPVTTEDVRSLVADSARFDVFRLVEASLAGRSDRAVRMTRSLRAEGVAPTIVSWAFARELRLLCQMRRLLNDGGNLEGFLRRSGVWERRKQILQQAMRRCGLNYWEHALAACARLDRMIKGQEPGDPWLSIERLAIKVAGAGRS